MSRALGWERCYPVLLGIIAAAIYLSVPQARNYRMPESLAALMAAVVSIGGISVGFLATAKSILVTIDDKAIIQKLKKAGYYKRIVKYLLAGIKWSFLLTLWSAAALLVDLKGTMAWTWLHAAGFAVWVFLAVTATLSYYRIINIFYAILNTLDK